MRYSQTHAICDCHFFSTVVWVVKSKIVEVWGKGMCRTAVHNLAHSIVRSSSEMNSRLPWSLWVGLGQSVRTTCLLELRTLSSIVTSKSTYLTTSEIRTRRVLRLTRGKLLRWLLPIGVTRMFFGVILIPVRTLVVGCIRSDWKRCWRGHRNLYLDLLIKKLLMHLRKRWWRIMSFYLINDWLVVIGETFKNEFYLVFMVNCLSKLMGPVPLVYVLSCCFSCLIC